MEINEKILAERIRERRKAKKMSQRALAAWTGISDYSSIWKIEKGKQSVPMTRLPLIAHALDTSVAYLMGETDNPERVFKLSVDNHNIVVTDQDEELLKEFMRVDRERFDQKLAAAYHAAPDKDQTAVRVVLDIDENGDKRK